jgi:glycosyltransferase involved in cell wall biosynthesis
MRILFLCLSSPWKAGGAETRAREIAIRLARTGHDVTVLCGKTSIQDRPVQLIDGVRIVAKKVLPDWLLRKYGYPHYLPLAAASLMMMFHLRRLLAREHFDLIREEIAPFPASGLISMGRLSGVTRIAVVHNLPGTFKGWMKFYGLLYAVPGYIMGQLLRSGRLKYDRIACPGKWFADELKTHAAISASVAYVANGVDLTMFRKTLRAAPALSGPKLLSVGRLVETKGHRYLIEALARLKVSHPQARLTLLGEGPLKGPLEQNARELGVSDRVGFLPHISYERMPDLYAEHDIFVMPSLFEGFPVALLEAMASGLPIVATDIAGIRAVLDESACLFCPDENADALAAKIAWAIDHPRECSQLSGAAYEIARQYDWDLIARQEVFSGSVTAETG